MIHITTTATAIVIRGGTYKSLNIPSLGKVLWKSLEGLYALETG
jgi:hypothetical protein